MLLLLRVRVFDGDGSNDWTCTERVLLVVSIESPLSRIPPSIRIGIPFA